MCTRALYHGNDDTVITGRSMDWLEDMHSDLWAFPRGMQRDGAISPLSPKWVSKYGSVITAGYNLGTADGMNEMGLVANLLYLAASEYGVPNGKPPLSITVWAQYVLDNFATVDEAVKALRPEPFQVVTLNLPNGTGAQLHMTISDPSGDSAIFEYVGGKLVIHHGKQYVVMTNDPTFDQQLAIEDYWTSIGGQNFLPGTFRPADRFARASFLIGAIPKGVDELYSSAVGHSYINQAMASVLGVIRSVGVPLGIDPAVAHDPSTIWRTVSDQKNKVYLFDSATSPNAFWVPLSELDLKAGAKPAKLTLSGGQVYSGSTAAKFQPAEPFAFSSAAEVGAEVGATP